MIEHIFNNVVTALFFAAPFLFFFMPAFDYCLAWWAKNLFEKKGKP